MKRTRVLTFAWVLGMAAALLAVPTAVNAGRPVGSTFLIRAEALSEWHPAIAYNSQWQEYLVVFWNERPSSRITSHTSGNNPRLPAVS